MPTLDSGGGDGMEVMVGRQPILDRFKRTVAYELLFRSGQQNRYEGTDGGAATGVVIANTFLNIGCERVLGPKRGFINFPEELLLSERALLLPREQVVVEVLETVNPDAAVVAACKRLKEAGFTIALDDVTEENSMGPLLAYADYVKLDLPALSKAERTRLCDLFRGRGLRVLAEKVETLEDFETALRDGCELFQGYFFARPEILCARHVPSSKITCLRLIQEAQQESLDFERLEKIVRLDIGLARKLLSFVNSAALGSRHEVESISQAFVLLGEHNIQKWVTLAALPTLATGQPAELVTESLVRARFAELAAERGGSDGFRPASCFLIGLMSLLDAMIGRPLGEILQEMGLDPHVTGVILNRPGSSVRQRSILAMAVSFERADFEGVAKLAAKLDIPVITTWQWYQEAITWADGLPR